MSRRTRLRSGAASLVFFGLFLASSALAHEDHRHRPSPALVKARQKFFGVENVKRSTGGVRSDRVIFSWVTNTTYAVSIKGRVILLDSFITRLEVTPGRTPVVIQDLVDLKPEAILLGHGHGDHGDNAAYLAKKVGIPVYATPETCDVMQLDAARIFGAGSTVECVGVISRGSSPGSEVNTLHFLEPTASVTVFRHLHSTRVPQDPDVPLVNIQNIPDPRDADMFPTGTPLFNTLDIRTTGFGGSAGPLSLFFQFRLRESPHFTFVWHNTSGALKEGCSIEACYGPEVGQRVADIIEGLPKTDVEFGSVVSLGFTTNGERDIVTYNQHVRPKIFVPGHMTAVAVESSSLEWKVGYLKELDAMSIPADRRPEVRWMVDPNDYLRPLVFDPESSRWGGSDRDDDD
jgi:hypothetical protein